MKYDSTSKYAGWRVKRTDTGADIPMVMWFDPDVPSVGQATDPLKLDQITGEVVCIEHKFQSVSHDFPSMTIWAVPLPVLVAPLGQKGLLQASAKPRPCSACCQEGTCERINYCAQFKCTYGEASQP